MTHATTVTVLNKSMYKNNIIISIGYAFDGVNKAKNAISKYKGELVTFIPLKNINF